MLFFVVFCCFSLLLFWLFAFSFVFSFLPFLLTPPFNHHPSLSNFSSLSNYPPPPPLILYHFFNYSFFLLLTILSPSTLLKPPFHPPQITLPPSSNHPSTLLKSPFHPPHTILPPSFSNWTIQWFRGFARVVWCVGQWGRGWKERGGWWGLARWMMQRGF